MSDQSKTSVKRLGIVGAAAVVGLVPISVVGASAAFAVVPGSATLSISPATSSSASVATNTFTTSTGELPAGGSIVIASGATTGGAETLPTPTTTTFSNYTVSYTSSGTTTSDPLTAAAVNATTPGNTATLTVANLIPAGATVTVTIVGTTNPTTSSAVHFSDSTSVDPTPVITPDVAITGPSTTSPTVSSVNPTAFNTAGGEPFTIMGTGFNPGTVNTTTGVVTPGVTVCFIPSSTTTIPGTVCAAGSQATLPTVANSPVNTATEIQGTSPVLTAGSYNVVVYNTTGGNSAASSQTLVGAVANLNVVPESGIRVVDSRTGVGLPKGALTPKVPYTIPASVFTNSMANPTNLPTTNVSALSLNFTAVGPATPGNLQVWEVPSTGSCGTTAQPSTFPSTVNFQSPQDTSNSTMLSYAAGGLICVQDNGASVPVVVDMTGYATTTAGAGTTASPNSTGFLPNQTRILDTRNGTGSLFGPLSSGNVYRFHTALAAGTPVVLNVTAVAPSSVGNLRVFPEPTTGAPAPSGVPTTSVITYIPNTDASSLYVTQVGANGNIDIYSAGTGTVNVVFDELGTLPVATTTGTIDTGSSLHALAQPFRIYDSRPGGIAAGGSANVTAAPSGTLANNVPATALGVVGDLGDINPAAQGNLRTYPAGGAVPNTSTINNFPMQTRSTSGLVALNPSNGQFTIYSAGSATNATFDVTGYIG